MLRKLSILLFFYLLPFIAVWTAWICTAMSFDAQAVFNEGSFWGFSMIYWFCLVCLTGLIAEAINETT
jgi:uncharacterized membrane protein